MAGFQFSHLAQGDVILFKFPYKNAKTGVHEEKTRPMLVISRNEHNASKANAIVALQITGTKRGLKYELDISSKDLGKGFLTKESVIRIDLPFPVPKKEIQKAIGKLKPEKLNRVKEEVRYLFAIREEN